MNQIQLGSEWAGLGSVGPVWTGLGLVGPVRTGLGLVGPVWTGLGSVWLDMAWQCSSGWTACNNCVLVWEQGLTVLSPIRFDGRVIGYWV